jgi:protein-tyrosine-phosphatase
LALVVGGVALIAAAVAGVIFLAVDAFPQPYLTFLILGAALLGAGLALHFLRGRLTPPARPQPATPAVPSMPTMRGADNPNARAAALQQRHETKQAVEEKHQRALAVRRAVRQVREELFDNRDRVVRASEGELDQIRYFSVREWHENEEALLALPDPGPHAATRQAYRELAIIENTQYIRDPTNSQVMTLRKQPLVPGDTAIDRTLAAIDEAASSLDAAERLTD